MDHFFRLGDLDSGESLESSLQSILDASPLLTDMEARLSRKLEYSPNSLLSDLFDMMLIHG